VSWSFAAVAVSEVEPNDAAPQLVGMLSAPGAQTIAVEGSSGYAGDLDWYSFEIVGRETQTVRLAVDSRVSWQIVLYSDTLTHVTSGTDALARDLAAGTYRVRIQASELGKETYVLVISTAIERESNDGLIEATQLGVVQTESLSAFASIDPAGDVDFFSFVVPDDFSDGASPGATRMLRIETPCREGDTVLLLYAEDDVLGRPVPVARNDDSGSGSWSRIYLEDPAPGTYTLRVHEYADNDPIASYRVLVTPMEVNDSEPNDSTGQAAPLGTLKAGDHLATTQFIAAGDVDAFSFDVPSSVCAVLETSGDSGGDSTLCVYNESGGELACDDDGGAGLWSRLFRRFEAGRYTVVVEAADEGSEFDYTLSLEPATCPSETSESEPNNAGSSANAVTLPVDIAGQIAPGDPDMFRFTLSAPATVVAETYGGDEGDTTLCLLDADGETVICDDDGGSGLWSSLNYELEAGTYFLEVALYAGRSPIGYHLLVRTEE
jgi:hypothetical protein